MSLPQSILAYPDCEKMFEAAMEDDVGVRFEVEDYDRGLHMRTRLHYYRALHRKENMSIYEVGHKMHGRSEFDCVVVRIKRVDEKFFVYLERVDNSADKIEKLSDLEAQPTPAIRRA